MSSRAVQGFQFQNGAAPPMGYHTIITPNLNNKQEMNTEEIPKDGRIDNEMH
jgi:hypothetical protein